MLTKVRFADLESGGPPRLTAGRVSAAGCKAGLAVGSAPWQFPADRLRRLGSCSRGNCRRFDGLRAIGFFERSAVGRLQV